MNATSEPLTVVRATGDSTAGYDAVFARHWHALVRMARLLVDDLPAAEDAAQDAFVGLHRAVHRGSAPPLDDDARVLAFLRAAVLNRGRSVLRRRVVARRHLRAVGDPDTVASADAPLLLAEEHRQVLAVVERLPRRQREVLVLRFWERLSDPEIATLLGIAEVTVRATASRALASVGRELAAADSEGETRD